MGDREGRRAACRHGIPPARRTRPGTQVARDPDARASPGLASALAVDLLQAAAVATVASPSRCSSRTAAPPGSPTSAAPSTASGIIAGLVATDLVLVMLVLAARVPFIERAVGQDAAMALHRSSASRCCTCCSRTPYSSSPGTRSPMAAGSSTRSFPLEHARHPARRARPRAVPRRRRSPRSSPCAGDSAYEVWHAIHLLVYGAVLAALPHQFSLGGLFAEGTWQRWYWLLLTIAAFAAIVVYRFGMPLYRTLRHRLVVEAVEPVGSPGDGVVSIRLRGVDLDRLGAAGGQFFVWRFLARGQWWQAHPYSLSAAPRGGSLRITVRALGRGSAGPRRHPPRHARRTRGPVRHLQRGVAQPEPPRARRRRHRRDARAVAARVGEVPAGRGHGAAAHAHASTRAGCSTRCASCAAPAARPSSRSPAAAAPGG